MSTTATGRTARPSACAPNLPVLPSLFMCGFAFVHTCSMLQMAVDAVGVKNLLLTIKNSIFPSQCIYGIVAVVPVAAVVVVVACC